MTTSHSLLTLQGTCMLVTLSHAYTFNNRRNIAVIGSRKPTPNGLLQTQAISQWLAQREYTIVAGLALGVDACAQTAALDAHGSTIAVLPSPIDTCYPASNLALYKRISADANSVFLSQFPTDTPISKGSFVQRDHTIALISSMIIITDATPDSGTRHVVETAKTLGTPILTTPIIAAYPWIMESGCPIHVYTGGHSFAREFTQALQERPHQYQTETLF